MDEEQKNVVEEIKKKSIWTTVTPLSRILTLILFIALPFIGFWLGYKYAKPQPAIDTVNSNTDCTQTGQSPDEYSFGKYIGPIPQCCNGLERIQRNEYKDGECSIPTDTGTICSNCGNDICEKWENRCNCPNDCK